MISLNVNINELTQNIIDSQSANLFVRQKAIIGIKSKRSKSSREYIDRTLYLIENQKSPLINDIKFLVHHFSLPYPKAYLGWSARFASQNMQNLIGGYIECLKSEKRKNNSEYQSDLIIKKLNSLMKEEEGFLVFSKKYQKENFLSFVYTTFKKIDSLESYQKILLDGGFSSSKGSHAMLYEFEKNRDNTLTWRIFNTGYGVEKYHMYSGYKQKYQTAIEIANINPKLIDERFLTALMTIRYSPSNSTPSNQIDAIYNLAKMLLRNGACKQYHPNCIQARQKLGVCTWKAQKAWLKFSLPDKVYRDFKSYANSVLLIGYSNFINSKGFENLLSKKTDTVKNNICALHHKTLLEVSNKFKERLVREPSNSREKSFSRLELGKSFE